ncbi:MAG: hypothetical protein HRU40_09265 [Saprospiraceae bacterium]|nr:hypothetical protein [Saprospiraceae bacterium]
MNTHLKLSLLAICCGFSTTSFAQLPLKSHVYEDKTTPNQFYVATGDNSQTNFARGCVAEINAVQKFSLAGADKSALYESEDKRNACKKQFQQTVPDGVGDFSFGSFNGGFEAEINAIQYNLYYSTTQYIPFYLFFTAKSEDKENNKEQLSSKLLGTNSGLLNIKFADDVYQFGLNGDGEGVCDFAGSPAGFGGCFINFQAGAKLLEYKDTDGKTKQLGAGYASVQFTAELPITKVNPVTKEGRLVGALGFSAYYANTDDVKHLFPELKDNDVGKVQDLKKAYASVDAGILFTISNQFSAKFSVSHPLVNDDAFETITKFSFTWTP